jgi:hypothetical protein
LLRSFPISTGPDSRRVDVARGPVVQGLMRTLLIVEPEVGPELDSDSLFVNIL